MQVERLIVGSPNEIVSGTPPLQYPKTNEEVKWRQMDIIYFLAEHGVPASEKDSTGQTPSDKAAMLDEINFMEGSLLLGIHSSYTFCCVLKIVYFIDIMSQKQADIQSSAHQSDPLRKETRGSNLLLMIAGRFPSRNQCL